MRIDLERRRGIGRPAVGQYPGGVADQIRRAELRRANGFLDRRDLRPDQRTAIAADRLKVHMVMARIDRRDDGMLAVLADDGGGIRRQRGHADHRLVGGQSDAARSGKSDPQAGEAAGTCGHRDAVEA